jgi:hypothetical protein
VTWRKGGRFGLETVAQRPRLAPKASRLQSKNFVKQGGGRSMLRTTCGFLAILGTALWAGCGQAGQSTAHGAATCTKPASQGGQSVPPQQNQSDLQITVSIAGAGSFEAVQSTLCNLTSGDLSESSTSSGSIHSDGSYLSAFSTQSAGAAWTSPLCGAVKNVKLTSVTSLTVQAAIPANDTNCQAYCTSSASSQCQGSVDPNCQASASASCKSQCKAGQQIKGHGSLQQSDMADTNGKLGSGSSEVDAKVDLVFDAMQ